MNPTEDIHSSSYRKYVLFALTVVYVFNFIDRQILVILQEAIKVDLGLSDTQLGLLSGFSFAIFYVTLGIPIAKLADNTSRKRIITISLTVWSAMTAISGLAGNFIHLLLARIGVGVGEAGGSPPAHSMISDYFPTKTRATAMSIYSAGIYIGVLIGLLVGGFLAAELGWRKTFYLVGLPGIAFAVIFNFTVKEPKRTIITASETETASLGLTATIKHLFSIKPFGLICFASAFHTFTTYGMGNWGASFLVRLHDMPIAQVGGFLALAVGVGGATGSWLGGYVGDKISNGDQSVYLKLIAIAIALSIPLQAVFLFSGSIPVVIGSLFVVYIFWGTFLGPSISVIHGLVPTGMRAMSSAVFFFVLNLIGLGLGPTFVGMASDLLLPYFPEDSIRWAMALCMIFSAVGAALYWLSGKRIPKGG
ncbi:MAG: MFS transporter [Cyclobacteriaceae bacterium]